MVRLDSRIEKRLDNYAILYCFDDHRKADRKAVEFVRRIQRLNKKKRYASLKYYRQQRTSCMAVKKSLESFAQSYVGMNFEERKVHDEMAMSFIIAVFREDRDNVFYLIDYYNQMKNEVVK